MSGDFTRNTFRADRGYSSVRMQQGRVLLDADWNEQADIARDPTRRADRDVIGPCGFPEDAAGFGLVPVPGDLGITPGRGYVGGVLIANPEPAPVRLERVSGSGANTLYRVAAGPRLKLGQPLPPPDGDLSAAVTVVELTTDAEGRQQVRLSASLGAGDVKDLTAAAGIGAQPHLLGEPLPADAGSYLAYLEVWERAIGALEDPTLREVALSGPDACQREQVIWQVRLLALADLLASGAIPAPPSCKSFGAGWRPEGDVEPARLAARAEAAAAAVDPCALPAAGGYRSFENHLYRVEVHNGGLIGDANLTFKWSRDNAMHRARLLEVADGALVVDSPGQDEATAYRVGEWLEVLDEARVLAGRPGFLVRLAEVNANRLGIAEILDPDTLAPLTDSGAPDTAKLPTQGLVRRWEGGPPVALQTGAWIALESGVEVRFEDGFLRPGDYWTIPARTVTADVEWPRDPSSNAPAAMPPEGVARRYCALAIVVHDGSGGWSVTDDCRHLFPPLTAMETFDYLGGDGQETMPDLTAPTARVALADPLRVGVARGETPVAGRLVRFTVEETANAAALFPPAGADVVSSTDAELIVRTGANGVAAANLALHPGRVRHHVTAELLDAAVPAQADRAHLPIRFGANLSIASQTAYDPDACAYQRDRDIAPGVALTVQRALDKLCPAPALRELGGDGQLLCVKREAPEPLRLGVFWGKVPLPNVRVDLAVVSGDARVQPATVTTGPEGIAETKLIAGSDPLKDGGAVRIEAKAANPPVPTQPQLLRFHARFLNAGCLYVGPDVCPEGQAAMGEATVAALLQHLCRTGGRDVAIHVTNVRLPQSGQPTLVANSVVRPDQLAGGIAIDLDAAADPAAFKRGPVGKVVFDVAYPLASEEGRALAAFVDGPHWLQQEVELVGAFFLEAPTRILWRPNEQGAVWLQRSAASTLQRFTPPEWPARVIVHGSRIWAEDDPGMLLDGDLMANPRLPAGVAYPSGDGVRGGDLVLPFRLAERETPIEPRSSLGVIPVLDGPVIGGLTAEASRSFSMALAAGIDRQAIAAVVPANRFAISTTTFDPRTARAAIGRATVGNREITVFTNRELEPVLDNLTAQYANLGVRIVKRISAAADVLRAYRDMINRTGAVDAILVLSDLEAQLRTDPQIAAKLGNTVVV